MRTTIHLPDHLLDLARKRAVERRQTLTRVIEDALRESLAEPRGEIPLPVNLTTFAGSGLAPGVDLDDSAALLDVMEGPDAVVRR